MRKIQTKGMVLLIVASMAIVVMTAFSLTVASVIKSTNRVEFCASCHEMGLFYETWKESVHGRAEKGVVRAKCVDCHLPYSNMAAYLYKKAKKGISHYSAHITKKEIDWLSVVEKNRSYLKGEYDRGCKTCHKSLVAPEISLKAFRAHRAYETGQTNRSCVTCHNNIGHKDLKDALNELS